PSRLAALSQATTPVLLEGEAGAGKRFVAGLLHEFGPRAQRVFATLDARDHDESVLAAILFDPLDVPAPSTEELRREIAERARGGTLYVVGVETLSADLRGRIHRAVAH